MLSLRFCLCVSAYMHVYACMYLQYIHCIFIASLKTKQVGGLKDEVREADVLTSVFYFYYCHFCFFRSPVSSVLKDCVYICIFSIYVCVFVCLCVCVFVCLCVCVHASNK